MRFDLTKHEDAYFLIVNCDQLRTKALEMGFTNVTCVEAGLTDLTNEELDSIKASNKTLVYIDDGSIVKYLKDEALRQSDDYKALISVVDKIKASNIDIFVADIFDFSEDESCSFEDAIKSFPTISELESRLHNNYILKSTDYQERCGNCHSILDSQAKYCKFCGTERGKGNFLPYDNNPAPLYGPPIDETFKCKACGHSWTSKALGKSRTKYCPKCGSNNLDITLE